MLLRDSLERELNREDENFGAANNEISNVPICSLCSNLLYMLIMLAITSLYFVLGGMQFWTTAYLITVVQAPQAEVFTFYTLMCLVSPALGCFLSIILLNCIGGYGSRGSLGLCFFVSALSMLFSFTMPRANPQSIVFCLITLVYFLNTFVLTPLTGLMLAAVPKEGRSTANSLANLCFNVFGYGLAPLMFGVVAEWHNSAMIIDPIDSMRSAMKVLMIWPVLIFICLMTATIVKLRRDSVDSDLKLGGPNDENYKRIGGGLNSKILNE